MSDPCPHANRQAQAVRRAELRASDRTLTWARKDVLSGLLFIAIALFGLWLSRDYPIGTALRMGTGYVPRLLCWILLGLGASSWSGTARSAKPTAGPTSATLRAGGPSSSSPRAWCSSAWLERLGLVVSILLLIAVVRSRRAACGRSRRSPAFVLIASVVGHLHLRAPAHHPGLAGVVARWSC